MKFAASLAWFMLLAFVVASSQQPNIDTLGMHNLTPGSGSSIYVTSGNGGCVFCHPPHSGLGGQSPLWNQQYSKAVYTPYTSSTYHQTGHTQPPLGVSSSLCLSCHDGTVAVGTNQAYGKAGMSGKWAPGIPLERTSLPRIPSVWFCR